MGRAGVAYLEATGSNHNSRPPAVESVQRLARSPCCYHVSSVSPKQLPIRNGLQPIERLAVAKQSHVFAHSAVQCLSSSRSLFQQQAELREIVQPRTVESTSLPSQITGSIASSHSDGVARNWPTCFSVTASATKSPASPSPESAFWKASTTTTSSSNEVKNSGRRLATEAVGFNEQNTEPRLTLRAAESLVRFDDPAGVSSDHRRSASCRLNGRRARNGGEQSSFEATLVNFQRAERSFLEFPSAKGIDIYNPCVCKSDVSRWPLFSPSSSLFSPRSLFSRGTGWSSLMISSAFCLAFGAFRVKNSRVTRALFDDCFE